MSTVGDIKKTYGKKYNISVSNLSGEEILNLSDSSILKENSIIFSSPTNNDAADLISKSIFITDSDGAASRLTYTIKQGNGLFTDEANKDIIGMNIDHISIQVSDEPSLNGALFVNRKNIIDNSTLTLVDDNVSKIGVDTQNLVKSSNVLYGISKGDEDTITASEGVFSVNTHNLDTVDDASNRDGIVRHSSEYFRTIEAIDGRLNVVTNNLEKASDLTCGVLRTDGKSNTTDDSGTLRIITSGLDPATADNLGVVMADGVTIKYKDGDESGVLYTDARELDRAGNGEGEFGVVRCDPTSIVSENGVIYLKQHEDLLRLIERNWPEHADMKEDITDLKNRVSKLETLSSTETIDIFDPIGKSQTILPRPTFDTTAEIVNEYYENKTISFRIRTNCKFRAKVEYVSNESPQIKLLYVNINNSNEQVPAQALASKVFDSTNYTTQEISFTFAVCNYNKEDEVSGINTNAIFTVASINNSGIKQTGMHVFTRWNNSVLSYTPPDDADEVDDKDLGIMGNQIESITNIVLHPNSASLRFDSTPEPIHVAIGTTGVKQVYFHTTVAYDSITQSASGKISTTSGTKEVPSPNAASVNVSDFPYAVELSAIDNATGQTANWLKLDITGTYNTTKRFNVLKITDTVPMPANADRSATIKIKLVTSEYEYSGSSSSNIGDAIRVIKSPVVSFNTANLSSGNTRTVRRTNYSSLEAIPYINRELLDEEAKIDAVRSLYGAETRIARELNDHIDEVRFERYSNYDEIATRKKDIANKVIDNIVYDAADRIISDSTTSGVKELTFNYQEIREQLQEQPEVSFYAYLANQTNQSPANDYAYFNANVQRTKNAKINSSDGAVTITFTYSFLDANSREIANLNGEYSFKMTSPYETKHFDPSITSSGRLAGATRIKINSLSAEGFEITPKINTPVVTGYWTPKNDNTASTPNTGDKAYTFGNAKISNIFIEAWDDMRMVIQFTITPGSTTNIPNGSSMEYFLSSKRGKTNFIFYNNGASYEYTELYSNMSFYSTLWKSGSGCVVTYRLYNDHVPKPVNQEYENPEAKDARLMYSIEQDDLRQYYTTHVYTTYSGLNVNDRDALLENKPVFTSMTGLKFWIGFAVSKVPGESGIDRSSLPAFESSASSLSDKISMSGTFNAGISKNVNITNALYTGAR